MLINSSNLFLFGPEEQYKSQGILGHYKPEFTGSNWWGIVRVPCPNCKPFQRDSKDVNWTKHLECYRSDYEDVDYYGYYAVNEDSLRSGMVTCPTCKNTYKVENKRAPRSLWAPILSTEKDQYRPIRDIQK